MKTVLQTLLFALLLTFSSAAQPSINYLTGMTPQGVVDSLFGSNFVNPTNVSWNGSPAASNSVQPNCQGFDNTAGFAFDKGIYLTTNQGTTITDPDLAALATANITNGGVLRFDFEALGDTLEVEFMFASSEYPTYVCSNFNDVFGFFISGPGITGPYSNNSTNIALVPNTNTPVAINTVNPGVAGGAGNPSYCAQQDPNWVSNSQYYTTLYATYDGENYNGGTVPITAKIPLDCGEHYTIKFAVANVSDQALNSGVYIARCQFPAVCSAELDYIPPTNMNGTIEGCQDGGSLVFNRVGCNGNMDQSLTTQISFAGTAQNGIDYSGVPSSITFAPFQTQIVLPLDIADDLVAEGTEDVTIIGTTTLPTGQTVSSETTFSIVDREELITTATDVTGDCHEDEIIIDIAVNQGTAPYSYSWSTNESTASITVPLSNGSQMYTVETTDACGDVTYDSITVQQNQSVSVDLTSLTAEYCPDDVISFEATVSDPNVSLIWDFGSEVSAGYSSQVNTQSTTVESAFTNSSEVTVIAGNGNVLCNDSSTVFVTIAHCGCTDVSSLNYDPLATLDDGSCVPSTPTVIAPNVFTPFDDSPENNLFFLRTENAKYIRLTIQNRWGNIVFEGEGSQTDQPTWDGTNSSGKKMSAGTYFYTYVVEGFSENSEQNTLTGQGFVELITD
ncbi:MAG: choice-of-anchor L domain-containing protein [Crocinitomicaceae bacterium]